VNDFIEPLLSHHTTVDVTPGTCEGIFTGRPGQASPDLVEVLKRPPQQVQPGTDDTDGIKEIGPDCGRQARGFSLVEANPTEHICGVRRGCWVMKNGTLYNSGDLYAAAGVQPAEQGMGRPGS
jgi:hypothetical protein